MIDVEAMIKEFEEASGMRATTLVMRDDISVDYEWAKSSGIELVWRNDCPPGIVYICNNEHGRWWDE